MSEAGQRLPFFDVTKQPPAEGWWVTDFTKEQIETRLLTLEAELDSLRALFNAKCAACGEPTGENWYRCLQCESYFHKRCLEEHVKEGQWWSYKDEADSLRARAKADEIEAGVYKQALERIHAMRPQNASKHLHDAEDLWASMSAIAEVALTSSLPTGEEKNDGN